MLPSDAEGHATSSRNDQLPRKPVMGVVSMGIPMEEYIVHRCLLMIPTVLFMSQVYVFRESTWLGK